MARRKTISPRDEYGNSFVTYSNPPAAAPLSQPSLQQEKQAEQSQILKQREVGGGSNDLGSPPSSTTNTTTSNTPPSSTVTYGPPPPNMAQMGLVDVAAQDQAETLGNVGKAVTTAAAFGKGLALSNPFTALATVIGYAAQAKSVADKASVKNTTFITEVVNEVVGKPTTFINNLFSPEDDTLTPNISIQSYRGIGVLSAPAPPPAPQMGIPNVTEPAFSQPEGAPGSASDGDGSGIGTGLGGFADDSDFGGPAGSPGSGSSSGSSGGAASDGVGGDPI